jgi:general secretion pathway protein G
MSQRVAPVRYATGFTLIEVLLVILIIGMLAGVLVVTIGGTQDGARIDTTKLTIQKLENKVQTYYMHVGHYPTEAEGGLDALQNKPNFEDSKAGEKWRGPYVKAQELNDAWGNKVNYEPGEGGKFKIWSNGPDQQSSTEDDISNQ